MERRGGKKLGLKKKAKGETLALISGLTIGWFGGCEQLERAAMFKV